MATLSARYAAALFTLASEQDLLNVFFEQVVGIRDALTNSDVANLIGNPAVPRTEKRDFLREIFSGKIHDDLFGLLSLMLNKSHEERIVPTLDAFVSMVNDHNGKANAQLVSASQLADTQIDMLKQLLSRKLNKQVDISHRVDPSLIGGFYIYVDGYLIDRTITKQLNDLRSTIEIVL